MKTETVKPLTLPDVVGDYALLDYHIADNHFPLDDLVGAPVDRLIWGITIDDDGFVRLYERDRAGNNLEVINTHVIIAEPLIFIDGYSLYKQDAYLYLGSRDGVGRYYRTDDHTWFQ